MGQRGGARRGTETWGGAVALMLALLLLLWLSRTSVSRWQAYAFRSGAFQVVDPPPGASFPPAPVPHGCPAPHPDDWHIAAAAVSDVTGDGGLECALLVWRPWRDWPIQQWLPTASPLTGFHDLRGDSCHLILLDPGTGREIWAGSALPAPLLALAVGDVDADGWNEVVTLEGTYDEGRDGPASHVDVWEWNGFGFTLAWRSPRGLFRQLRLTDVDGDAVFDIAVR